MAQDPMIANPPTLLLPIHKLAGQLRINEEYIVEVNGDFQTSETTQNEIISFIKESLPRLQHWIKYIMKTQSSRLPHAYRWYGRSDKHCLASGFDDFPRHSIISDMEGDVDLMAWLAYSLRILVELQELVNPESEDLKTLRTQAEELRSHVLNDYWDSSVGFFGDLGMIPSGDGQILGFETHVGYVGLIPFALQLLDPSDPRIGRILDAIEDPEQVMTGELSDS